MFRILCDYSRVGKIGRKNRQRKKRPSGNLAHACLLTGLGQADSPKMLILWPQITQKPVSNLSTFCPHIFPGWPKKASDFFGTIYRLGIVISPNLVYNHNFSTLSDDMQHNHKNILSNLTIVLYSILYAVSLVRTLLVSF